MIDYAAAGDLLAAFGPGAGRPSTATPGSSLFTDDAEYHEDPFGAPLVGHNALRSYMLNARGGSAGGRVHRGAPLGLGGNRARCLAGGVHATLAAAIGSGSPAS